YYGDPSPSPDPAGPLAARPQEWRTPPLWGLRDTGPYLHDGRAATVVEAIRLHGGEGGPSAQRFAKLRPPEQASVLRFLDSLTLPAGDAVRTAAPHRGGRS